MYSCNVSTSSTRERDRDGELRERHYNKAASLSFHKALETETTSAGKGKGGSTLSKLRTSSTVPVPWRQRVQGEQGMRQSSLVVAKPKEVGAVDSVPRARDLSQVRQLWRTSGPGRRKWGEKEVSLH